MSDTRTKESLTFAQVYARQIAKSFTPKELKGLISFMDQDCLGDLFDALAAMADMSPENERTTPIEAFMAATEDLDMRDPAEAWRFDKMRDKAARDLQNSFDVREHRDEYSRIIKWTFA